MSSLPESSKDNDQFLLEQARCEHCVRASSCRGVGGGVSVPVPGGTWPCSEVGWGSRRGLLQPLGRIPAVLGARFSWEADLAGQAGGRS